MMVWWSLPVMHSLPLTSDCDLRAATFMQCILCIHIKRIVRCLDSLPEASWICLPQPTLTVLRQPRAPLCRGQVIRRVCRLLTCHLVIRYHSSMYAQE